MGHKDVVQCCAFSLDGELLVDSFSTIHSVRVMILVLKRTIF